MCIGCLKVPERAPDLPSCPHAPETARASTGLQFAAQTDMQMPLASHFNGPALSHFLVIASIWDMRAILQGFLSRASDFTPSLSTVLMKSLSSSFQKPRNFPDPAIGSVGL